MQLLEENSRTKKWADKLTDTLHGKWKALALSAALATIFEHLGLLTFMTKLSMMVVSNLAAIDVEPLQANRQNAPAVITIDDVDFQDRYLERSPLNRCVLAKDLQSVLAKSPKAVGVDLDLSPQNGASLDEMACQAQLDRLLDANADKFTLLAPFPVKSQHLLQIKHQWMRERCAHQVNFADGILAQSMGMVIDHQSGIRYRLAEMVSGNHDSEICNSIRTVTDARANMWLQNTDAAAAGMASPEAATDSEPINFTSYMQRAGDPVSVSSRSFASIASLAGRPVFFGGTWGSDDNFSTPVGMLPGVAIHAARAVSLEQPIKPLPKALAFVVDLLIGFLFSLWIEYFWELFIELKVFEAKLQRRQQILAMSSAVLVSFLLAYAALSVAFFVIAQYLFTSLGLLLAPLLMAITMLSDGFVSGPLDVFLGRIVTEKEEENSNARALLSRALLTIAAVIGYVTILFALLYFHQSKSVFWLHIIGAAIILGNIARERIARLQPRQFFSGSGQRNWASDTWNRIRMLGKIPSFHSKQHDFAYIGEMFSWVRKSLFWLLMIFAGVLMFVD